MRYRTAAAHIARRYTLDLAEAPFDAKDSKLLASAGNCTKCPKRAGNQPEIYPDAKNANICTDPDCFQEKTAAHYQAIVVHANKRGIPVLEGKEAGAIRSNTWSSSTEFVLATTHLSTFERVFCRCSSIMASACAKEKCRPHSMTGCTAGTPGTAPGATGHRVPGIGAPRCRRDPAGPAPLWLADAAAACTDRPFAAWLDRGSHVAHSGARGRALHG